jgi:hypothetical protein
MSEGTGRRAYVALLEWPVRAAIVLFGHVVLAGFLVTAIWGLQEWARFLYGEHLPLIWGIFPLEWLFQTMDMGVVAVFFIRGIISANHELSKQ